ncbi:unnamed protein product [Chironomus riparius]|uniref:Dynein heavy chain linker domain-containing protein n=1 Tax=Chironomus riparius TaxID=315576 RepID=A0A9N9RIB7_9DIPT|nr:unnamed protein product [Chironomus riparius]
MNSNYNAENILTLLNQIEKQRIVPTNVCQKILRQQSNFNQFESSDIPYFPLEWFDIEADVDYDSQYFRHCREGLAFLPVVAPTTSSSTSSSSYDFEWHKVSIKAHNNESNKWHIEDVSNGDNYEVPRIYLMFIVEDPQNFIQRMRNAIQHREECERNLRFETILNEFPMNRVPHSFVHLYDKIEKLLNMSKTKTELMEFYQREACIVFQKTLVALQLKKFINERKSSSEYLKQQKEIELPRKLHVERNLLKNNNNVSVSNNNEIYNKIKSERNLKQLWLYCCPQSIKIMEFINNECESVSRMSFFHIQTSIPTNWETFHAEINSKIHSMSNFLKSIWIDRIVCEIQSQLANVGKGWYDMRDMTSWSIYKMSKLSRMIELIKQRMEVSVMKLLRSSLAAFVNHLCRPCECLLNISNDYEWMDDDLLNSPFHSENFIFKISLNIDNERKMPIYSTFELQNGRLEREILEMYYKCILTTHDIPQIDPYLMKELKFDVENLKLSSIGILDVEIQNQILQLTESYRKCLIPLYAYARKYEKFVELKCLDVQSFVGDVAASSSSVTEFEHKIHHEIRFCEELRLKIPNYIIIGPFFIDIEDLKTSLIKIQMEVIKALKENLVMTANNKLVNIQKSYDAIVEHLTTKPLTIEHLDDINKWIPSIPNQIQKLSNEMRTILVNFRIIESFWIDLSDEMFKAKWKALRMPQIVNLKINEMKKQHAFDVERFTKLHASNLTVFAEKVKAIPHDVDECLNNYKTGDEIFNLWDNLISMREHAELLNKRCLLLNQPEIDMELLTVHIERLYPHQNFWTMTLNFLSSKQMWTEQMPLSMLDVQSIEAEIERYDAIVQECRDDFSNDTKMMNNIHKITIEIQEFEVLVDILKDLKNSNLKDVHFEKISTATGIVIDDSTQLKDVISYNARRFLNILKDVNSEASREAARERQEIIRQEIEEEKKRLHEEEVKRHRELRRKNRQDLFKLPD